MRRRSIVLAAWGVMLATAASAGQRRDCYVVLAAKDMSNLALGSVVGGKVKFRANTTDLPDCPSERASCERRAFLLDANLVMFDTRIAEGGYVCAAYLDAKGHETDGWLPAASVKPISAAPAWIGTWKRDTSSRIDIKRASDTKADLHGEATWGEGARSHVGVIDAALDPRRADQRFATNGDAQTAYVDAGDYDCAVKMKQLGPYLFVEDNDSCGGANVSFTGIYIKR